jgi:hypothetical protein
MPAYVPGIVEDMFPDLKKHMQGTACFSFKSVDKRLLKELDSVTTQCYKAWQDRMGRMTQVGTGR